MGNSPDAPGRRWAHRRPMTTITQLEAEPTMDSDHGSVIAFLDRFADAWKRNDASAAAALFVDDGSLINPFGQRADGHAAVQAMYADYFSGMLRGTTTTVVLSSVRGLGADHAFA